MSTAESKRAVFQKLHRQGCFVIPNPWDVGSARYLESLGFPALATTSSGIAWSMGHADNRVDLEEVLVRLQYICTRVDVPVNADFEGGFASRAEGVAANVKRALSTGLAGISIEDSNPDSKEPLYPFELAVDRVRAAVDAVKGTGVLLTARTEGFIVGRPDIDETLKRLVAFAEAGADCLYAPGIRSHEHIQAVVKAASPLPVNLLVGSDFITVAEAAALGVRRISVGGALARAAWTGFMGAAREIAADGTFQGLTTAAPFATIEGLFKRS